MIGEQMDAFINSLIQKTEKRELKWEPLTMYSNYDLLEREVKEILSHEINPFKNIFLGSSYFLKHGNGYLFLCNISLLQKETSIPYDEIFLFTKISPCLPLDGSAHFSGFQPKLETLKLVIEQSIESNYQFPDDLYKFWEEIIADK